MMMLDKKQLESVTGGIIDPAVGLSGRHATNEQLETWRSCLRDAGVNNWAWTWHRGRKCDAALESAIWSNPPDRP